jgi:hypothetical protein
MHYDRFLAFLVQRKTGQSKRPAAAGALQADVGRHAGDDPFIAATGMLFAHPHTVTWTEIGHRSLDEYLMKLLYEL